VIDLNTGERVGLPAAEVPCALPAPTPSADPTEIVLSEHFFKHWPAQELNGPVTRESNGHKVVLPIWHKVTKEHVADYSPMLADRVAAHTKEGLEEVVAKIIRAVSIRRMMRKSLPINCPISTESAHVARNRRLSSAVTD